MSVKNRINHIDTDRIRQRLTGSGLLDKPSGDVRRVAVQVVVVDLTDYAAYIALRRILLEEIRVRSALPVEMEHGRAVLAVDGELGPVALLDALRRAAPEGVRITPVGTDDESLTLRVRLEGEARAASPDLPARLTP